MRNLGLKNNTEWRMLCTGKIPGRKRLPADIPANPENIYADRGLEGVWRLAGDRSNFSNAERVSLISQSAEVRERIGIEEAYEWLELSAEVQCMERENYLETFR